MENLTEYLPFLIPLIVIDIILALTALVHIIRHPNFRFGNKFIWIPVVLFIQLFGPAAYFLIGRGEE